MIEDLSGFEDYNPKFSKFYFGWRLDMQAERDGFLNSFPLLVASSDTVLLRTKCGEGDVLESTYLPRMIRTFKENKGDYLRSILVDGGYTQEELDQVFDVLPAELRSLAEDLLKLDE